jgi:hypothetical protein
MLASPSQLDVRGKATTPLCQGVCLEAILSIPPILLLPSTIEVFTFSNISRRSNFRP